MSSSSNTPHHPRSSVSAAVSDESVAGDSGVYEAAVSSSSRPGNIAQGPFVYCLHVNFFQIHYFIILPDVDLSLLIWRWIQIWIYSEVKRSAEEVNGGPILLKSI